MDTKRLHSFLFFCIIIFMFFVYQIYNLQIRETNLSSNTIAKQATQNYYFPSPRGDIFDRNGNILARTTKVPKLYLDTNLILSEDDVSRYLDFLSFFINLKPELSNQEFLEENKILDLGIVDYEIFNSISLASYDYPALLLVDFPYREYPYGSLASHILGYTGIPNQDDVNLFPVSEQHQILGKMELRGITNKYYQGFLRT